MTNKKPKIIEWKKDLGDPYPYEDVKLKEALPSWEDNFKEHLRYFEDLVSDYRELLREALNDGMDVNNDIVDKNKEIIEARISFLNFIRQTIKIERAEAVRDFRKTCPNPCYSQGELDRQKAEAVKEYEYILKQKIGLLRQWINEDRINNIEKIVSSEQIEKWLIN